MDKKGKEGRWRRGDMRKSGNVRILKEREGKREERKEERRNEKKERRDEGGEEI